MTRIFISHSHSDEAIAFKLVNFLLAALGLKEKEILCTSNPDQGLEYRFTGITDQLKNQLKNSEALIILITSDSLHSAWIPFEAGSFWTTDKPIIPILGPGLTQNDLPGPLKNLLIIPIDAQDFEDRINNATNQVAKNLNLQQEFTRRRNYTLQEFCAPLRAWQSKRPAPDTSQPEEIERLKAQIQESEKSHSNQLEELKQSLQSQIKQLEKQLEQERSRFTKQQANFQAAQEKNSDLSQKIAQLTEQIEQLEQERSRFTKQQADHEAAQKKIAEKEAIIAKQRQQIEQLKSSPQNTPKDEVELKSEKGVDYTKLRDLLEAGKWKEADKETANVMLEAASQKSKSRGWLEKEDIDNFPCEDLRTINQLWVYYSDGKFGFSVQKEIYESLGGTREYNSQVWNSFGDRVGWKKGENWLGDDELTWNLEAPTAHLPRVRGVVVLWGSGVSGWSVRWVSLLSREDL